MDCFTTWCGPCKMMSQQENLKFLDEFTHHSSDAGFRMFLENPAKINAVMGKGFVDPGRLFHDVPEK